MILVIDRLLEGAAGALRALGPPALVAQNCFGCTSILYYTILYYTILYPKEVSTNTNTYMSHVTNISSDGQQPSPYIGRSATPIHIYIYIYTCIYVDFRNFKHNSNNSNSDSNSNSK